MKTLRKNVFSVPVEYGIVRASGILPCLYHRYYHAADEMLKNALEDFSGNEVRAQKVKAVEEKLFELYKNPELSEKPKELEERGGAHYSDAACEIISSIYNDSRTDMVVSTPNNGAIYDLPYDCIAEVSCAVTAHGPEPYTWGKFPLQEKAMLQLQKGMEQLTVKAAVTGDYELALQAFNVNPLIPGGKIAKILLD